MVGGSWYLAMIVVRHRYISAERGKVNVQRRDVGKIREQEVRVQKWC